MTYILSASERALRSSGAVSASSWYWREVKADWRRPSSHETYEAQAIRYARWLAARDGVSLETPDSYLSQEHVECEWTYGPVGLLPAASWREPGAQRYGRTFIRAVEFGWQSWEHGKERHRYEGRRRIRYTHRDREVVARIEIPNHDRVCGLVGAWTVDDACNYIPMEIAA